MVATKGGTFCPSSLSSPYSGGDGRSRKIGFLIVLSGGFVGGKSRWFPSCRDLSQTHAPLTPLAGCSARDPRQGSVSLRRRSIMPDLLSSTRKRMAALRHDWRLSWRAYRLTVRHQARPVQEELAGQGIPCRPFAKDADDAVLKLLLRCGAWRGRAHLSRKPPSLLLLLASYPGDPVLYPACSNVGDTYPTISGAKVLGNGNYRSQCPGCGVARVVILSCEGTPAPRATSAITR